MPTDWHDSPGYKASRSIRAAKSFCSGSFRLTTTFISFVFFLATAYLFLIGIKSQHNSFFVLRWNYPARF